jgi:hypothetical protein
MTDPFTGAFEGRLEEQEYAYRLRVWKGERVAFKYFC